MSLSQLMALWKKRRASAKGEPSPPNPGPQTNGESAPGAKKRFGKEVRKDFLFDEQYLNLNHGSFGTYPRPVRDALRRYQDLAERRPDDFIRSQYPILLDKSRAALANLIHAPLETVVIIPNATTGVNVVLRNLSFERGDVIVYFETIYGACEKAIAYIEETTPARSKKIGFTYPISDAELVTRFRNAVRDEKAAGRRPRIALFDTICSMPGVRMPFEQLSRACRELGVMSLVDGAHGVGNLELDMEELGFDFFVSNCHKWLFTPRGCAVFYVPERNQKLIRSTLPTSHGFVPAPRLGQRIPCPFEASAKPAFVNSFEFVGTTDNSAYLAIPAALAYRASLGGEAAIASYQRRLARDAGERVAAILGTEVMGNAQGSPGDCAMSNVRLPLDKDAVAELVGGAGYVVAEHDVGRHVRDWMAAQFVDRHGTYMALTVLYGGAWWVRLSATVYLEMEDFEWGARVLEEECERVRKGEFLEWLGAKL